MKLKLQCHKMLRSTIPLLCTLLRPVKIFHSILYRLLLNKILHEVDHPSFSSLNPQTHFHDQVDLSYPYKVKEPYFPTVFGTFRIQQNYERRNRVDITSDFSFKQRGYVPQFQHSSTSFPQAMSLLGQDIEYWANQTK
jgi:hypothetical protein